MTLADLRHERGKLIEQARAIYETAKTEKRSVTAEEEARFDALMSDSDQIKKDIGRRELLEQEERALEESLGRETRTNPTDHTELRSYLLGQHNTGQHGMTFQLRAQSVGTDSEGGYTVAEEPIRALEVALKSFGGVREVSRVIRTTTGADLPHPTMDDTSNAGSIVGENTDLGSGPDLVFGQVTFKAWKYSSGIVLMPWELVQDASVNIAQVVRDALGTRLARIQNTHFTTGDDSGKPEGVVTGASDSGVTTTTLGTITYDELTDAMFALDASYRRNGRWMFNSQTLAEIRKVTDDSGRPLFYGQSDSIAQGHPETLLGKPYTVNEDMPDLDTASAKAVLFGDFSRYVIRDVAGIQLIRMNERYADTGQIAMVAHMRCDGRLLDAGTNPVQYIDNAAA